MTELILVASHDSETALIAALDGNSVDLAHFYTGRIDWISADRIVRRFTLPALDQAFDAGRPVGEYSRQSARGRQYTMQPLSTLLRLGELGLVQFKASQTLVSGGARGGRS